MFRTAKAAVKFAVLHEGRPAAAKLDPGRGSGGESSTVSDADGQAGLVMATLRPIGPVSLAALTCDVAPQFLRCECRRECCAGRKKNSVWTGAAHLVANRAVERVAVLHSVKWELCAAILRRYYGDKLFTQTKLAAVFGLEVPYVAELHSVFLNWYRGRKEANGLVQDAWIAAEERLRSAGLLEES